MENQKKKDPRKILLVLPLLLMPFLALAFYALGWGQGSPSGPAPRKEISTSLPNATFKKEVPRDKMDIYQLGAKDSASKGSLDQISERLGFRPTEKDPADQINEKLELLGKQISSTDNSGPVKPVRREIRVPGMKSDVDRLESLMSNMQSSKGEDAEMKQLSGMLEKVLDIQHPERVRDAYIRQVNDSPDSLFAAIPAVINRKQTVSQGSALELRLTDSLVINGIYLSKGQLLFGICNLTNQRLLLDIKTIRTGNRIIPVDLSVYGLDGIRGISAPDAVVGQAISGGADDAVRSLQFMTMDQSMGAQVAGAGIDAAKSLFSKKVKRVKIKFKPGYSVLLRNNQPVKKY
ncbi:conjugative transposon protein TraM [Pedobacter yonginense]|nr:conjugative transposon protein TraM [Pedobacter yonginense]